jgi:ligand-binding sensor domain-containing protein/DNA-binding CsgD family transcriptional regulator
VKNFIVNIFFFFLLTFQLTAQDLLPFVENYNKSNYQGDNQIWSVAQGQDNAMYFANNYYLLRYDGVKWDKYSLPNKTIIRSVMVDKERVYTGSYKEFGYWVRKAGKMTYTSLSKGNKIFDDNNNEEIWKIFKFKNELYFQSFNSVFVLKGTTIKRVKFPFLVSYCFLVDDTILVATVDQGIYKMVNYQFEKMKGTEVLEKNVIHAIKKHENKTYFFTKKNGVYVLENGRMSRWNHGLNSVLMAANINVAQFLTNNKLAIGTANKGLFIYDMKEDSFININRDNILMNNSILSITVDKENDLWLGLDNGIGHVEVNSPISIFYDSSGILGSVYSVASIPQGYLMASNHGIYQYADKQLSLIPQTQGQAWNISKIGSKYVIGHNEGTFTYENGALTKLSTINGGWNMVKSGINNSYLQATYGGIVLYNDITNLKQFVIIDKLQKPIKYIAQNRKNEIWAADNNRGLYRILYNDSFKTTQVQNITKESQIENDFGVKIIEFRNEILFLINRSWYTFNSITNQLVQNKLFNSNFRGVSDVVTIDDNHFMVLKNGLLYIVFADGTHFVWNLVQEKYYRGKIINDNLKIYKNNDNYLLNLDDGFIKFQIKNKKKTIPSITIEAFSGSKSILNDSKIDFNSEIKLNIISGIYGANKPNLFYKINKSTDFVTIKEGEVVLNNLEAGDYKVFVFSHDGSNYKQLKQFEFEVAKPWYWSFWMIVVYIAVLALVLYVYYKWNKMRYLQKLLLREEELKHQKRILEIELKAENELNTQEYEKHILELELQSKSSEVAGKSLSIAKQSEMIENIQSILDTEHNVDVLKKEIKKAIKINAINKHEWETFETNLNQMHNEFIIALSKKFLNLTPKDIKLCIYLKMNLTSKEIAPMMNISYRGVELHRYRLRKKLGLVQEENLSKFLLSI